MPRAFSSLMISTIWSTSTGASPMDGSSMSRILGLDMNLWFVKKALDQDRQILTQGMGANGV